MMDRREFLESSIMLAAGALSYRSPSPVSASTQRPIGQPQPFDYAWLKGHARSLAQVAYLPPPSTLPPSLSKLDYDQYQALRFRRDQAQWGGDGLDFRIQYFHRGPGFKEPVRIYEVVSGHAREIAYHPAMFDFRKSGVDVGSLPTVLGFAGFRVQHTTNWDADIAAFLGASYFRAVAGDSRQYGLSARGLAIDTAMDHGEEFPLFTAFWLERPAQGSGRLVLYALLDSPSVAGAYRCEIIPGPTLVMEVDASLYPRKTIERLGVAPFSSMFQCGENDRRMANDWRPEIHDSDGLSVWTGAGEWIWRPLVNAAGVRVNSYFDENPRGFGLLQRDRKFDHYQDDGAYYERRPSVWVEPKPTTDGGWGKGAVQLVELPTVDETFDNIVAFWNPADMPQAGQELLFSYRLYWSSRPPFAPPLAQVVATRTGMGGVVGQKRHYFSWRFAVDFAGGELAALDKCAEVEPVISASRGRIEITSARPQFEITGYRAMFDLRPTDDSTEPIDLRLYLRLQGKPWTETWMYQWTPPPVAERKY
jgi:glucans biosynthesis protein